MEYYIPKPKKQKINRRPVFYRIYFTVLIVAVLCVIAAIIVINCALRDFESVQPKYAAEDAFNQYFKTSDKSALADALEKTLPACESRENIEKYVDEATSGDMSYYEVSTGLEAGRKYTVKSGDKRVFTFTLNERSKKSAFGFVQYEFGGATPVSAGSVEAKINVPQGYSVAVNGVTLDDSYITERDVNSTAFVYLPKDINIPKDDVYTVQGLLYKPEVTSQSSDGRQADVKYDDETKCFKANLVYDDTLKTQMSTFVLEAAQIYARYMLRDASFNYLKHYLDPSSELYELTRTTITSFTEDHNGYSFENESADEFIKYDDNNFSCRVRFVHKLHKTGAADYAENVDMTLFFRHVGEDWLIYDRFNTN